MRGRSRQVAPKTTPGLQFVVRTLGPGWRPGVLPRFREGAAGIRIAEGEQARKRAERGQAMSDSKLGGASVLRPAGSSGRSTTTSYDKDVILWSQEQARLLRAGRFTELDIEHLADEIEDVGKSEKRELASRVAVLLAHLLKWSRQRQMGTNSWRSTINVQRKRVALAIKATPSLKAALRDPHWQEDMWLDALAQTQNETGLMADLPEACPWTIDQAVDQSFWPE
jgi:hypothetical protein